jgi:hypothetical protein
MAAKLNGDLEKLSGRQCDSLNPFTYLTFLVEDSKASSQANGHANGTPKAGAEDVDHEDSDEDDEEEEGGAVNGDGEGSPSLKL